MDHDEEIKKRIRILIDSTWSGNLSEFARAIDMKPSDIQNMLSNDKRGVPASFFKAVPKSGVNLNWLVTGKADMLRHDKQISDYNSILKELEKAEYYIDKLEKLIRRENEGLNS